MTLWLVILGGRMSLIKHLDLLLKVGYSQSGLILEGGGLLKPELLAQESVNVVQLSILLLDRSRNSLPLLLLLEVINRFRYTKITLGTGRRHLIKGSKRSSQVCQRVLVKLAQNGVLLLWVLGQKGLE